MRRKLIAFSIILLALGLGILIEQYFSYGVFIDRKDVLHHEFFAFTLISLALGLIIGNYSRSED